MAKLISELYRMINCFNTFSRRVQLFESGVDIQTRVLLLLDNYLRPLLYAGHRLLGVILARPERHPRQGLPGGDNLTYHVHSGFRYQRSAASSLLYKGHRRLDWGECVVCLLTI